MAGTLGGAGSLLQPQDTQPSTLQPASRAELPLGQTDSSLRDAYVEVPVGAAQTGSEATPVSLAAGIHSRGIELVAPAAPVATAKEAPSGAANSSSASGHSASGLRQHAAGYFSKWKGMPGKKPGPIPPFLTELLPSFVGSMLSMGTLAALNYHYALVSESGLVMLIASFAATAVLCYGAPHGPLSQPRNVFFGHVVGAFVGRVVRVLISDMACKDLQGQCAGLGSALSVSLAITAMQLTGTLHPPGGATALVAVVGDQSIQALGWLYIAVPAALGAAIMLLVALLVNNLSPSRSYPQHW